MNRRCRSVVLALLVGLSLLGCGAATGTPPASQGSSPAVSPSTSARPLPTPSPTVQLPPVTNLQAAAGAKQLRIGPAPDFAVISDGFLFVTSAGLGIQKIAADGTVAGDYDMGDADLCTGMDVGFGAVWAGSCAGNALRRIDARTGKVASIDIGGPLSGGESSVGAGEGGVWLMRGKGPRELVKVDPSTLAVVAHYHVAGPAPLTVRAGLGAVWVADIIDSTVSRVDPKTGAVLAVVKVGRQPEFMAIGEGAVWTMDQLAGTVSRIDPATNKVTATIALGELVHGGDIAVGGGSVWLRGSDTLLFRIDPTTNTVAARYSPDCGSGSVAADDDNLWITAHDCSTVWRVTLP